MSGGSSNAAGLFTRLEPVKPPDDLPGRLDDARLGEVAEFWRGDLASLKPGRAVLIGFPQDEGIRRNHGRPGAALAPREIRRWLYRLSTWDLETDTLLTESPPLDAGDLRLSGTLEETQAALGDVVAGVLERDGVPVVLGGGHETAYGHYLGYAARKQPVAIINIDAHLDVRPVGKEGGHSGSPFRQAMEHPTHPLPGNRYVCLGAQPYAISRSHWLYARERGCVVRSRPELLPDLAHHFAEERRRLEAGGCRIYVTLDADAVRESEAPGVSAPNPAGLPGAELIACARAAGASPSVASFDLVEVNPNLDHDQQTSRWAALAIWSFLVGLASRNA